LPALHTRRRLTARNIRAPPKKFAPCPGQSAKSGRFPRHRHCSWYRIMRRHTYAAALSMAFLTGCAPIHVNSYLERGVDFAQYHTYDWGPSDALPTGDPRLDNNPFFHDYFQGALEKRLSGSGLRKSVSGTPDLLIHYKANMSQSFQVSDGHVGTCNTESDCEPRVTDYESGTLVVDFRDARTNQRVWRGSVQQSVDGLIDNQAWMEKYLDKAVALMMERFPVQAVPGGSAVARNR
jgi:hypothetical protein